MLGTIIRKINIALLEKDFELKRNKRVPDKYYLCGYKMALNDIGYWLEKAIRERNEDDAFSKKV